MQPKASVSYKSPKPDIWAAYQELLQEMQPGLPNTAQVKKLEGATFNFKRLLTDSLSEFSQEIQAKINDLSQQFDQALDAVKQLQQLHSTQSQTLKREEEESRYEFEKLKKRQAEELTGQKQKAEAEITARKTELKLQEDEVKDLRQKVVAFETQLDKAVKEAVGKTTQELTREFTHQKALSQQQASAQTQLLAQKVDSLEATIKNYQSEIVHLQTSLKEANQQLTRIAERAVEKGPAPHTVTQE